MSRTIRDLDRDSPAESRRKDRILNKQYQTIANLRDDLARSASRAHHAESEHARLVQELTAQNDQQLSDLRTNLARSELRAVHAENEHARVQRTLTSQDNELQRQLTTQTNELQHLRAVHAQKGDFSNDEAITNDFDILHRTISDFVHNHYLNNCKRETGWRSFDGIKERRDKAKFLRSVVADEISGTFFSGDGEGSKVFGYDVNVDRCLGGLEREMEGRFQNRVARDTVTEWRLETLRLISELGPTRMTGSLALQDELMAIHNCVSASQSAQEVSECAEAMRNLCKVAFDIAITLRRRRAEYVWTQQVSPWQQRRDDVDWVDAGVGVRSARVVSGAVYVMRNGERVLLRRGEVLRPPAVN